MSQLRHVDCSISDNRFSETTGCGRNNPSSAASARSFQEGIYLMPQVVAYFDPSAGSLVLQAILGGASGLIVLVRYLWQNRVARRSAR